MSQDTVLGQGTAPDPEDETYLSLLKGTSKKKGIQVKVKKENAGLTTPHGPGPPDHDKETYTNLLKGTVKVKKVKIKKEEKNWKEKQDEELEKHKTTVNVRAPKGGKQADRDLTPSYIGGEN